MPAGFFAENGTYEFQALLNGEPVTEDVQLLFNDVPSDPVLRRGVQYFPLEIGFYAGRLEVSIIRGCKALASVTVDVHPDISKLTRDEYATMISEISRSTLALYRLGGLTVPAEVDASAVRSDLVTLDLIRSNFDAFECAALRIADQPSRRLETTSSRVNILSARRIDDRAISNALRSGEGRRASAAEARATPRLVGALGGQWIPKVVERHREERTDVYENRALLGFMRWIDGVLANIRGRIIKDGNEQPDTVAMVWLNRLSGWRRRIASLGRRDIFSGVLPDPALRATSVFRMHPDYAAAFSSMVRMKAGLGTGAAVTPSIPMDRTFALYEMWCYVGMLHGAAELFPSCRSQIAKLLRGLRVPSELGTILAQGESSTINLEDGITLVYQRRFSTQPDPCGSHTLLIDAVPDITIAKVDDLGRCTGLVVLDPKYRRGASLLDGIRDLHVYRDAILGDNGTRIVVAASALAPCALAKSDPGLSAAANRPTVSVARVGHDPNVFVDLLKAAVQALNAPARGEA